MIQDILGLCIFTTRPINEDITLMVDAVKGIAGWDTDIEELRSFARSIIVKEHQFNLKAGLSPEEDRLPAFMRTEALPPNNLVFEMDEDEFQKVWS
jgi:aldehyde:ferredoxin oxidoreductase